ncbi:hypothetical protein QQF64_014285 [Cirrhinus molitorella]|uniref:TRIM8/14/16/25/29/45/65 coiled-coil region domain-containing protein n=1 Tax=Cirrhinus molitorella TaxID=172907 RepID=A0ABR3NT15_9TELE
MCVRLFCVCSASTREPTPFRRGWTEELYGMSAVMEVSTEMQLNATAARPGVSASDYHSVCLGSYEASVESSCQIGLSDRSLHLAGARFFITECIDHIQRSQDQLDCGVAFSLLLQVKQLKETQKTFQQRIQQREKDVQQLREAVESHKRSAQTAVEDSERIFTELIRSIERSRSELIRLIRDQEKTAVSRAEGRLERLEQEINDLRRRDAELEQLSHTQDHIQFLHVTDI